LPPIAKGFEGNVYPMNKRDLEVLHNQLQVAMAAVETNSVELGVV